MTLRTVLLLLIAGTAVPTLAFSAILLDRYAETEHRRAAFQLEESAQGIARAIDAQFATVAAAARVLAASPLITEGNLARYETLLRTVATKTGRDFALADASGKLLYATIAAPGGALPETGAGDWPDQPDHVRGAWVSPVLRRPDGGLYASLVLPIRSEDGTLRYLLRAVITPSDFSEVLARPGVPKDWVVSIVDGNGTHMLRSHGNDKYAGKPLVAKLIAHMRDRQTRSIPTVTHEGIPAISTVAYAKMSGWATAVGLPEATLVAPMREQLGALAVIGGLLVATALVLALLTARYIDRSFRRLSILARRVGRGEAVEAPAGSLREFHNLGETLSEVSHALRNRTDELARLNETLEEKVSDRTAELTAANRDLVAEMRRREESELQLRQMQKMEAVGQLTGGIAHDFNNMLAVIVSSLNIIRRRLAKGDTDIDRFIESAQDGADRAAGLTRRLLAFSRQQPLAPVPIDANALVRGLEPMLRRTFPETMRIEIVLADGLWRTHADVGALESSLVNLAVNARDAMSEGGKLTIETSNAHLDEAYARENAEVTAGQYVEIAVSDTGEGMPPEVVAKAFDPFFTTKPPGQGTGMGLSQVFGFVKQTGGHIKVYSEPGMGTTVRLYLPRFVGPEAKRRPEVAAAPEAPRGVGETVLVVEDDARVRQITVAMLEELDYAVAQADGAAEALRRIDDQPEIALLLTDVVMPDMNGRALADAVLERRPDIKVLFTTGYTRNAIIHNGVLDPDVELIAKPFTIDALAAKLRAVLDRPPADSA